MTIIFFINKIIYINIWQKTGGIYGILVFVFGLGIGGLSLEQHNHVSIASQLLLQLLTANAASTTDLVQRFETIVEECGGRRWGSVGLLLWRLMSV